MINDEVKNPFPGLRPFEFGDNHLFFGRDQQTTELTTRLRKNRFVAVVGTSGSGKSSLVRAGLMPELLSGTMASAGSSWETAIMRPGGDPLTNLANAIVDADLYDPDLEDINSQVRATLTRSGLGLLEAIRQSELPEGTNFLLVVDQFEEIFRFRRSDDATDEQAAFFVNLLLEASAQADLPLYIIITMRSDFLGECSQFPRLADTVNEGEFLIPRLNRDQRKEAILGPVKVAGGGITDRLLIRLLNDIGDDPDQLPILQHALMRTWDLFDEQGGKGELDLEHYQATGGMGEALSRHADEVYNELSDGEHKRIAEKLFKSLTEKVDANRGIRRPMQLLELHEICGGEEQHLRDVLDAFRKTGCTFLMPAGESEIKSKTIIDISHESLMRVWRSLRNWVDEEAQSAKIYRRLADTASLYKENKAGLYRDPDLQIALSWRKENRPNKTWADRYYPGFEGAMSFLDESHEESVREERMREEARQREVAQAKALVKARTRTARIFKFASIGITILLITSVLAMLDARKSKRFAEAAILEQARRSERLADKLLLEKKGQAAIAWLNDAINLSKFEKNYSDKLIGKMAYAISYTPKLLNQFTTPSDYFEFQFSKNKKIIVFLDNEQFSILNVNTGEINKIKVDLKKLKQYEISHDGNFLVAGTGNELNIYNLLNRPEVRKIDFSNENIDKYILSQNKIFIKTNKSNYLCDLRNKSELKNLNSNNYNSFKLGDNSKCLFFFNSDSHKIEYLNLNSNIVKSVNINKNENILDISHYELSGNTLLISIDNKRIHYIYKINRDFKISSKYQIEDTEISKFQFAEESELIGWLNNKGEVTVYNSANNNVVIKKVESPVYDFDISDNGTYLACVSNDKTLSIFNSLDGQKYTDSFLLANSPTAIHLGKEGVTLHLLDMDHYLLQSFQLPYIKSQDNANFPSRFANNKIIINAKDAYYNYRIKFPKTRFNINSDSGDIPSIQLAEIKLLGQDNENIVSSDSAIIESGFRSSGDEKIPMAFDGNIYTKFFSFNVFDVPAVTIKNNNLSKVSEIIFTSANDIPDRDPIEYEFLGSLDNTNYKMLSKGAIVDSQYVNFTEKLSENLKKINDKGDLEEFLISLFLVKLNEQGQIISDNTKSYDQDVVLKNHEEKLKKHFHDFNYSINTEYSNFLPNLNQLASVTSLTNKIDQEINNHRLGLTYLALGDAKSSKGLLYPLRKLSNEHFFDSAIALQQNGDLGELKVEIENKILEGEMFKSGFWTTQIMKLALFTQIELSSEIKDSLNERRSFNYTKEVDGNYEVGKSNNYVEIENNKNLQISKSITIEFWAKLNGNRNGFLVNKGGGGVGESNGYAIWQAGNFIRFELRNSSTRESTQFDTEINESDWFHFAVTWDYNSKIIKTYINGVQNKNRGYYKGPIGISDQNLNLGRSERWANNGFNIHWDGALSELRIWNIPLSSSKIKNQYNNRIVDTEYGLTGVWPLNSSSNEKVVCANDNSLSGYAINRDFDKTDQLPFGENIRYIKFNSFSSGVRRASLSGQLEIAYALRYGTSFEQELILTDKKVYTESIWPTYNPFDRLLLCLILIEQNKQTFANKLFNYHLASQAVVTTRLQNFASHAWRDEALIKQLEQEIENKLIK